MTDKQKILAEIERLRKIFQLKYQQLEADDKMCLVVCGKRNLCNDLISFINSIPDEPASEDLEEAAKQYATVDRSDGDGGIDLMKLESFIAGAQWQKRQTIDKACMYLNEHRDGCLTDKYIIDFRKAMEEIEV